MCPNGQICSTFFSSLLFFPSPEGSFFYISLFSFSTVLDLLTGNTFDWESYLFLPFCLRLEVPTSSANIDGSSRKLPHWQWVECQVFDKC